MMKSGYTGKVFIVIDNEDKQAEEYRNRFGDKVLQFDKSKWAEITDEADNFNHRKAIVYARNACWELARSVGCRYFVQFDDDYTSFFIRYNSKYEYVSGTIRSRLDDLIDAMLTFYIESGSTALAMSQGGDHIGGDPEDSGDKLFMSRKCMNSWFCDTEKPIKFFGHMNEDVSAYVTYGHRGELFFTVMQAMLVQKPTQVTPGGMSDLYISSGTYAKSFYTVMANPSCVRIGAMGDPRGARYRIHHKINWPSAVPKIIQEGFKK